MVALSKIENFVEDLGAGVHQFGTHAIKVALSSTINLTTNTVLADLSEPTGAGYVAGGDALTTTWTRTGGTASLNVTSGSTVWNATGTWTSFQYVVPYNDTPAAVPTDPLIGSWDYGQGLVLNNGDSFTVNYTNNKILDLS